jgi:hypothetical protein
LLCICAWLVWPGRRRSRTDRDPLFVETGRHWKNNYGRRTFLRLGAATAASGLLAYTGADEAVESWHRDSVRSSATDQLAHIAKFGGERFWFLAWGLLGATDAWLRTSGLSRWGRRNFEAMVVGLPTLWTLQRTLGANRPSSDDANPRWRPMAADNSASGHAFIGAIPWLHLAHRVGGAPARWAARGASALTGWSRLNDRKHYPGQIILGWTIAWNAVEATRDRDPQAEKEKIDDQILEST